MRLLNAETLRLEYFQDINYAPKYAILSHTWGDDEILFQDLDPTKNPEEGKLATTKPSLEKVLGAAREALSNGFTYIWIDSCCIDKSSSAELSEAINSMFSWYAYAEECYAYLSDVTIGDEASLPLDRSRWFTRGWTLQELIAPGFLIFFDSRWKRVGTRAELAQQLATRTKIPVSILNREPIHFIFYRRYLELRRALDCICVSARMLWAEGRKTTRQEDGAYSLMGIFDVNMPLLYGEGHKAFRRLQEIILTQTNDQSVLAYRPGGPRQANLANEPSDFVRGLETYQHLPTKPMAIVSGDIEVDVLLCSIDKAEDGTQNHWQLQSSQGCFLAVLHCNVGGDILQRTAILLKAVGSVGTKEFTRIIDNLDHDSCFKLQPGDDGKTWAVSAHPSIWELNPTHNVRLCISELERTRIVIKPPEGDKSFRHSNPGKQVPTEFPLQISLRGSHSGEFCFFGELEDGHTSYEISNGYIRVDATNEASAKLISVRTRSTAVSGAWDMVGTGIIYLIDRYFDERESENFVWVKRNPGFNIMWGYKFPTSKEPRTPNPREDEMICYVFPMTVGQTEWDLINFAYDTIHDLEFPSKAATVSSCWNKDLGRRVKAEIWTKTVLDRTCSFLTVDVSDERDEGKASDEDEARDGGKAGDEGKADDEGKKGDEDKASDEIRH